MSTRLRGAGSARRAGVAGVMVAVLCLGAGCHKKKDDAAASNNPPPAQTQPTQPAPQPRPAPPPARAGSAVPDGMERFTNTGADNQIDVPKDWTHDPVGESLIIVSPDKQVFIELSASLSMGQDKADEKKLMARLERSLQHVKRVGPITKSSQNGLNGWKFSGTATKSGRPYRWESFALEDTAGKGAFGLVYASAADLNSHRVLIERILGSVSAVTK